LAGDDVELDDAVVGFVQGRVVVVPQAVAQRHVCPHAPFVLRVRDVVLLLDVLSPDAPAWNGLGSLRSPKYWHAVGRAAMNAVTFANV
jgi:hypothetical protein